jgi:hypothetical protein
MRSNPERLAWTILLSSFTAFCVLVAGAPYAAWRYVTTASDVPRTVVYASQGTLLVTRASGPPALSATTSVSVTIEDDHSDIASLSRAHGGIDILTPDGARLAALTVYEKTQFRITQLSSPRYQWSTDPYMLTFYVNQGRLRVQVPDNLTRPIHVLVSTAFGEASLSEGGAFVVEVDEAGAQISVQRGIVVLACGTSGSTIVPDKLGTMGSSGCAEAVSSAHNIVRNGNFQDDLASTWEIISRTREGFPLGVVESVFSDGLRAAQFRRTALDWGLNEIKQTRDYNIRDKRSVVLQLDVRIDQQDLDVCGTEGTECPIMVNIEFEDQNGNRRSWQKGFYAVDFPGINAPTGCLPCGDVHDPEWFKLSGLAKWETYESGDLIEQMKAGGFIPTTIISIDIYASGHTYLSMVRDVRLLIQD